MKKVNTPKCPNCNKTMILRTAKKTGSQFWGCSGFPKCRGTRQYRNNGNDEPKKSKNVPSHYQVAIFNAIQKTGDSNIVGKATAGSGKTWTTEQAAFLLPRDLDICYAVFNAHVREEAKEKMPSWVDVMTTHQLAFAAVRQAYGKVKIDSDGKKVVGIIKDQIQETWDLEKWMISPVKQIVGLLKNTLTEPTLEGIAHLVEFYGIEVNDSFDRIAYLAQETLRRNNRDTKSIDFDDMLYFPIKFDLPLRKWDWLLLDEVQDFNAAQIAVVLKSLKPTGRVLAVGDSDQSMYGFRGASIDAMDQVKAALDAKELPLSITYRCPLAHVELVNSLFPDIAFEAAPNAKEGEIVSLSLDKMLGEVVDGDMVLCRTNAPLVAPCFELIRQGKKAIIRGRNIGDGLVNLIKKFEESRIEDTLARLVEYGNREVAKLLRMGEGTQAQNLSDRVATIIALSDGCSFTYEVKQKIEDVFSDKKEGIVFSSVHKAKGLEAENVYILEAHLMPHPMAKKDWEIEQEDHILFVSLTRSKNRLGFVGGMAGLVTEEDESALDVSESDLEPEQVSEVIDHDKNRLEMKAAIAEQERREEEERCKAKMAMEKELNRAVKEIKDCPF